MKFGIKPLKWVAMLGLALAISSNHLSAASSAGYIGDPINDLVGATDLIEAGKTTELHEAAKRGDIGAVRAYIDRGGFLDRVDGDRHTAIDHAAKQGHIDIVRLLLEHGAATKALPICVGEWANSTSIPTLHQAVHYPEIVALLLENGAKINAVDTGTTHNYTALDQAVMGNEVATLRVLLNPDNVRMGKSHLLIPRSARRNALELVELLKDRIDYETIKDIFADYNR